MKRQLTKKQKIKVLDELIRMIKAHIEIRKFQGLCLMINDAFDNLNYNHIWGTKVRFPQWNDALWKKVEDTGGTAWININGNNVEQMEYRLRFVQEFRFKFIGGW